MSTETIKGTLTIEDRGQMKNCWMPVEAVQNGKMAVNA